MQRGVFSSSVGSRMADTFFIVVVMVYLFGCIEATRYSVNSRKNRPLVIDHDGGADDAFGIILSLLNEKYVNRPKLVALTTTFGNVNLSQSIINSDRVLRLCKRRDIPIYSGAHQAFISNVPSDHFFGYDGMGDDGYLPPAPIKVQKEPAAVALIELSKKYEGELVVIAIGPVTNIALAIRLDPKFIHRLAHLYVGGGHIYSEQYPNPEFNANLDPEAYHIVAEAAKLEKVTFVPFSQIKKTLNISAEWRTNVLGRIESPTMQALNGFERISIPKSRFWTILDPAVIFIALFDKQDVNEFRYSRNDIILQGDKRGLNTNNFTSKDPNARILCAANKDRYKRFLLDTFY